MKPGFWMVRCCRRCPDVAARIWLCSHEPGLPDNPVDQPYWQGQIGLDLVPPGEVWEMLEFCEASPEERAAMERPLSLRADVKAGRVAPAVTAPMSKWKQQRARRITEAEFAAQIRWLLWAEKHAPRHPDFKYRVPVKVDDVPIPQFARS